MRCSDKYNAGVAAKQEQEIRLRNMSVPIFIHDAARMLRLVGFICVSLALFLVPNRSQNIFGDLRGQNARPTMGFAEYSE